MKSLHFSLLFLMFFIGCQSNSQQIQDKNEKISESKKTGQNTNKKVYNTLDTFQTFKVAGHLTDILSPVGECKGNILVLPGWDFPRNDWCQKSSLCKTALKKGYRLIMPEMARSVYSSRYYKETLKEWLKYPNKGWLTDSLIPYLQNTYGILLTEQNNYVLGLSTGGRGVALLILAKPGFFKAGAALSGDFDQTKMPQDRLMIGFYGNYQQFPERWVGEDNPFRQIKNFKTPLYLGHGINDKIVPFEQSQLFYEALKKAQPDLKVIFNQAKGSHDYLYWDSEVEAMLKFFEENK